MRLLKCWFGFIKPLHPEGWPFVTAFAAVTLLLFWLWTPLGWIGTVFTIWCAYFFRDPERVSPDRAGVIASPADGLIVAIGDRTPPPKLGLSNDKYCCISIFMSVFDVHVNRMPLNATVEAVVYEAGAFFNASNDKASEKNERNGLLLRLDDGRDMGVVQIAGLIARRIVCNVKAGDRLAMGERFGIIRFGSRVDVYLPQGSKALVLVGQRTVAGETILAEVNDNIGDVAVI